MKIKKILSVIKRKTKKSVKKLPNPVRWGIIGTGYMANTFSYAIEGSPNGVVHAVASRSKDKAKTFSSKHSKCVAYDNYDEFLNNPEIDVVYIATPLEQHYSHIKKCLLAGKSVLCEKPMVKSSAEIEELIQIANDHSLFLMEGMWSKCLPTFHKARQWLAEGKIGNLEIIRTDFYKREIIDTKYAKFDQNRGGGVISDFGIYAISFATSFFDNDFRVYSSCRQSSFGIDSDWFIRMYNNELEAYINISSDFAGSSKAALIGSNGTIEWSAPFNRTNTITLYDKFGKQIESYSVRYKNEGFEYEVEEVQKCIKEELVESNMVSLASSSKCIKTIEILLNKKEV